MSTALYRRYRPETFDDVIGQEHVTAPLLQALRSNRVNHAYLFSGPRGCGKTTSARILARILNCARREPGDDGSWPDAPCGECDSCRELARGGSGSLDVVEIDAASHGGVDDARELRERATFAPARDRYKVFVIDEAHMVTNAGFNALLKIVEEPPEHVRFIFATTEPEKVLPTIRSRTHHYPFHLVPSQRRLTYLRELCEKEGVPVGKGVLELVVRAGEGSVRDSLSVLDQLMAGAGPEGVDYERAVALLGYTDASLLDDVVEALAAADGATVFRVVDRVIESGHDPRRFVEDLLERLRDLIIVRAVGEGAHAVLRAVPEDQLARMSGQASRYGVAELSRAADVANAALTEMTGATSPRLHLELLCARMLLPGADASERGLTARLDRLERRVGMPVAAPAQSPAPPPSAPPSERRAPAPSAAPSGPPAPAPTDGGELDTVRRMWPDVLERLKSLKRTTWSTTSHAHVLGVADGVLRLGFTNPGALAMFSRGAHADFVRQALIDVLGLDVRVEPVPAAESGAGPMPRPARDPSQGHEQPRPSDQNLPSDQPPSPDQPPPEAERPDGSGARRPPAADAPTPGADPSPPAANGTQGEQSARPSSRAAVAPENDEPDLDDPDAEDSGMVGPQVVEQLLGGKIIQVED